MVLSVLVVTHSRLSPFWKYVGRISGVGSMAAHALAGSKSALDNRVFAEAVDVPLIDAYPAVGCVSRSHLAVGHTVIGKRCFADVHDEVTPLRPLTIPLAEDRELK